MTESQRWVTLGSIDNGATLIRADVRSLGFAVAVKVTLTSDYTLVSPRPPGFPTRPCWTGCSSLAFRDLPGAVIEAGSVLELLQCEATALINAGAATLN
jgi:hypothetical protein